MLTLTEFFIWTCVLLLINIATVTLIFIFYGTDDQFQKIKNTLAEQEETVARNVTATDFVDVSENLITSFVDVKDMEASGSIELKSDMSIEDDFFTASSLITIDSDLDTPKALVPREFMKSTGELKVSGAGGIETLDIKATGMTIDGAVQTTTLSGNLDVAGLSATGSIDTSAAISVGSLTVPTSLTGKTLTATGAISAVGQSLESSSVSATGEISSDTINCTTIYADSASITSSLTAASSLTTGHLVCSGNVTLSGAMDMRKASKLASHPTLTTTGAISAPSVGGSKPIRFITEPTTLITASTLGKITCSEIKEYATLTVGEDGVEATYPANPNPSFAITSQLKAEHLTGTSLTTVGFSTPGLFSADSLTLTGGTTCFRLTANTEVKTAPEVSVTTLLRCNGTATVTDFTIAKQLGTRSLTWGGVTGVDSKTYPGMETVSPSWLGSNISSRSPLFLILMDSGWELEKWSTPWDVVITHVIISTQCDSPTNSFQIVVNNETSGSSVTSQTRTCTTTSPQTIKLDFFFDATLPALYGDVLSVEYKPITGSSVEVIVQLLMVGVE